MSWAPSLMSAEPEGGSRCTISTPDSSKCWMTSSNAMSFPFLLDAGQDRLAVGQPGVQGVDARDQGQERLLAALGRCYGRVPGRHPRRVDAVEQREVEVVDAAEDGLVHLDRVEESGVAAVGVADARHRLVETLPGGLHFVDEVEVAAPGGGRPDLVQGALALLEARREVLALQ